MARKRAVGVLAGHTFPIRQDVCYKSRKTSGIPDVAAGRTVYISSREVEFTTEQRLNLGQKIEVSVNWPAKLDHTCLMKLVISGHVIRNDPHAAAVSIEHYEFRTRAGGGA